MLYCNGGLNMNDFIFKLNSDDVFSVNSASIVEVDLTSKEEYKHTFFNNMSRLYRMQNFFQNEALDLWYISLMIYYVDKKVSREGTFDNWTRQFKLYIPVLSPEKWNDNKNLLIEMITFLSGDLWEFEFRKRELNSKEVYISEKLINRYKSTKFNPDSYCMLSGGLDSFIGAIDLLKHSRNIGFVSHYGGGKGVKPYQEMVQDLLRVEYGLRGDEFFNFHAAPIGGSEDTTRTRSFMFFSHAIILASCSQREIELYIPENGLISLNIPFTNTRLGSSSTRTTHPFYLKKLQELLDRLGITVKLKNPYQFLTKGEMLIQCTNDRFIKEHYKVTMSCSHPDQVRWEKGSKEPIHCGTCLPCSIRRASILRAFKKDETLYNDSKFKKKKAKLEMQSFKIGMLNYSSLKDHFFTIQMSGRIDEDLEKYSDLYKRGMEEFNKFIKSIK
ncbi:Qat anti-phage system QueC-like protein QatC [Myroides odoratimimus]|uniref:Qat anti-phage system QueC-like protein QatC n=3 Tax=Myroides odoratimimus TaxID=76832 RepID=UPI002DBD2D5E|nr:Qat anti-phage system QueC-like protein QatC [Myroides odoratimimus]